MSELKSIFSSGVNYEITPTETVFIKELCLKDIHIAIDIASKLNLNSTDLVETLKKVFSSDQKLAEKLFLITTNLKPEEIEKLNPAACILIATKAIEVNADFFAQQVVPALKGLFGKAESLTGSNKSKS